MSDQEVRTRFAHALAAHSQAIADAIAANAADEMAVYEYLRQTGDTSLTQNTRLHLERLALNVRAGGGVTTSAGLGYELSYRRAQTGLPLSNILRVWQITNTALWQWFCDHAESWGDGAFREMWPLWISYADEATHSSVEAYVDWQRIVQRGQLEAERLLLTDLSRGTLTQLDGHQRLLELGLDLDRGVHVSVLIPSGAAAEKVPEAIAKMRPGGRENAVSLDVPSIVVRRESDIVVLHAAATDATPVDWLRTMTDRASNIRVSGVVASAAHDVPSLRAALKEAEVGAQAAAWTGSIVSLNDLDLVDHAVLLLASNWARLAPAFIAEVPDRGATLDWAATIVAWAESGWNPREASKVLHVHPNTVYYRLAQFQERTGLDLHQPKVALSTYLAARVVRGRPGETLS